MKKRGNKSKFRLAPTAQRLLVYLLTPIAAAALYTAFCRASLDTYDAARLYGMLGSEMEHILMSLLLSVGGVLALDITLKRG